ncbi:PorT family protein [Ferruginibacter lapsinanis]|uniref:outer membrane beta-barrel protein n=1 Tax=Ferruginibacter lapsinanis TaxID=563172 RepID=UPI001E4B120E|nr:outer membrane beta-barrel protein [Ferruginibacter lapsinanis]UEG48616.1 PorT family protein [Ferruginibacter lapsinanis]
MKKFYLLLIFTLSIIFVSAQTKIALKAGWNVATARVRYVNDVYSQNIKQPSSNINGFGLGIMFKTHFDDVLHFSPTISYNMRGYIYNPTYGDTSKYYNTIHYIDITPALSADFPVGERKNTLVLSAGPQLGIAIAGTEKTTTKGGVTSSNKMKLSVDGEYGMFDLGFSSGLAFHTPKVFVELGYLLGLANINNNYQTDHRNIRNRMISVSFGYYLR